MKLSRIFDSVFEAFPKEKRIFVFLGAIGLLLFTVEMNLDSLAENRSDESHRSSLRWRLPAEREYMRIRDAFMEKRKIFEQEYARQPKKLEGKKIQLRQEEERLVQHVMDKHGFTKNGFWKFPGTLDDEYLKLALMAEDPELYRVDRMHSLQMEIQGFEMSYTFYKTLQSNRANALQELRQQFQENSKFKFPDSADSFSGEKGKLAIKEIEQMTPEEIQATLVKITASVKNLTKELIQLEQEEMQWQFPWPKSEEKAFSEISLAWWDLKKTFLEQYDALSTASPSYPRDRWDLTQAYRTTLRELMRSHRVQPAHIDEYYQRTPRFLKSYLQQHAQQREQAKKIQTSLKEFGHALSFDQAEGMGLIIGTVIQRADLTEKGKGDNRQQRVPVAEIPIELVTQGDTAHKPQGFFWRTTSNAQGQFAIPAVPPGNYYLSIMFTQREKFILYRAPIREFFVGGNQEVLILDMLVEKVGFTIGSASPVEATP